VKENRDTARMCKDVVMGNQIWVLELIVTVPQKIGGVETNARPKVVDQIIV
jgi:hypothetical protein